MGPKAFLSRVVIGAALLAALCVVMGTAQSATCNTYQQLQLYYDSSSAPCTSGGYFWWTNGTCYSTSVYFSVDGETWGTGLSAMFVANYGDVGASTWSFFGDNACQKRLHGIDGLSCSSCISNPSGWILSINSDNITGFNIASSDSPTTVEGGVSHASNRRQVSPRRPA